MFGLQAANGLKPANDNDRFRGSGVEFGSLRWGVRHGRSAGRKGTKRRRYRRKDARCAGLRWYSARQCVPRILVDVDVAFADSENGAWLSPAADNWPLIPIHASLTPDGRVLSFGTNDVGQQTGIFSYDVWDPADGLEGPHTTLPNFTQTDIFCGFQLLLPDSGKIVVFGGDIWDGTATTNVGNNRSTIFDFQDNSLVNGNSMVRQRWYASATVLMNGEVYIQGGSAEGLRMAAMGTPRSVTSMAISVASTTCVRGRKT